MTGLMINHYTGSFFEDEALKKWSEYFAIQPKEFFSWELDKIKQFIRDNDISYIHTSLWKDVDYSKLKDFTIPVIIGLGDAPRAIGSESFKRIVIDNKIWGVSFHSYAAVECMRDFLQPYEVEIIPYILGINLSTFKDYGLNKEYDVVSTGKYSNYQFRREIDMVLRANERITFARYRKQATNAEEHIEYAKVLNRSLIGIGGCMQHPNMSHYKGKLISDNFPKNFEICATKTCLLSSDWGDREFLGFRDGLNCIIFSSPRDAIGKVLYYKENPEELNRITYNGYELVHNNFDYDTTAKKLVKSIEKKING